MVQTKEKKAYPYNISTKNWRSLRRKINQAVPTAVNASYLQSVLDLGGGAAGHVLHDLKAIGFVGDDGLLTQRALDWRDDELYPKVCAELRAELYPPELRDAFVAPGSDKRRVEGWFKREAKIGDAGARKMSSFYLLICEADPRATDKAPEGSRRTSGGQGSPKRRTVNRETGATERQVPPRIDPEPNPGASDTNSTMPSVHIDIQIHIDASASADQIDQIFRSMRQHLYGRQTAG